MCVNLIGVAAEFEKSAREHQFLSLRNSHELLTLPLFCGVEPPRLGNFDSWCI